MSIVSTFYLSHIHSILLKSDSELFTIAMSILVELRDYNLITNGSYKFDMLAERVEDISTQESREDSPTQPSVESAEALSAVPSRAEVVAEENRPLTPSIVRNLMEMGFSLPQVNVARERYLI